MVTSFPHYRARRNLTLGQATKTTNMTIIEVAETMVTTSIRTEITSVREVTDHDLGVAPAHLPRTKIEARHAQLQTTEAQGDTRRPKHPSIIQSVETSTPKRSSSRFRSDSTTSQETLQTVTCGTPQIRCFGQRLR